jgi:hypothetical protein
MIVGFGRLNGFFKWENYYFFFVEINFNTDYQAFTNLSTIRYQLSST